MLHRRSNEDMLKTNQQIVTGKKSENIRFLYDKYAGMLLGYVIEITKDRATAEKFLVNFFCDLSGQLGERDWEGLDNWCQLQRYARERLDIFMNSNHEAEAVRPANLVMHGARDKYLEQLSEEQRQVFCDVYYYRKSIEVISSELNKTEDSIRKTLKEAFAIMRKSGEN